MFQISKIKEIKKHQKWTCDTYNVNFVSFSNASYIYIQVQNGHYSSARLWTQYKFEKITGISMNLPLFRPRSIRHSRFLLISIPTEKLVKNRTVNEVWKRLLWSLQSAFHGVNPPRGMPGRPLSEADIKRSGSPLTRTMTKFALTDYGIPTFDLFPLPLGMGRRLSWTLRTWFVFWSSFGDAIVWSKSCKIQSVLYVRVARSFGFLLAFARSIVEHSGVPHIHDQVVHNAHA